MERKKETKLFEMEGLTAEKIVQGIGIFGSLLQSDQAHK